MATVNLRSKRTETENTAVVALYKARCEKVAVRKKYENEIEKENNILKKEVMAILEPVASSLQTPIEIIVETNRCVLQKKIFCSPKAKQSQFVTTMSIDLPPIGHFMASEKNIKTLPSFVEKAIRRLNIMTKKGIGKALHPLIASPATMVSDLHRRPGSPMVIVTFNVRTRYEF